MAVHGPGLVDGLAHVRDHPGAHADLVPHIGCLGLLRGEAMTALPGTPAQAAALRYARRRRRSRMARAILIYSVLVVVSLIFLMPFMWMMLSGLKTRSEVLLFPPTIIPRE